jgi:ribosomal protein S18 acetylase RimI-like enzyme
MSFTIRPYHPSDLYALYQICLRTGAHGADASHLYRDPELLGHYYAAPYAVFEPDLCFVLTSAGAPCGYVLGTRDSAAFYARCAAEWFPILRQRYPLPHPGDESADAQIIRLLHGEHQEDTSLAAYPAHLHIDLLPIAQGHGWGRALMVAFLERLRELGVPGVHLGVSRLNQSAIGFYERVGFHTLSQHETWLSLGMRL